MPGYDFHLVALVATAASVATEMGGIGKALDGTGLVVPTLSPERLVYACLSLLGGARMRQRLGSAARARALEYFAVDEAIKSFAEIYHASVRGMRCRAEPCLIR
jgi:glycosyltransferase involved in cell wall biosynthesis